MYNGTEICYLSYLKALSVLYKEVSIKIYNETWCLVNITVIQKLGVFI